MGRIKIEKIENLASRQVTFSRRQKELFKKAKELSILCDVEVAVIVFSDTTDEPYEFSSTSMERTLSRYGRRNIDLNEVQHRPNDQPQAQDVEIEATILQEKKVRRKLQARGKQVDEIDNTRKSELDKEIPDASLQLGLSSPVYQKKRSLRMRASNQ